MIHSVLVDHGGTKTEVLALNRRGRVVRKLRARSKPVQKLHFALRKILRRWHVKDLRRLTIGAKSIWSKKERKWLHHRTKSLAKEVIVQSDAELAYERVFGARSGILIIAGTGSIALGRNDRGKTARAGGLGPKRGDEGSAFWIGKMYRNVNSKHVRFQSVQDIAKLAPRVIGGARKGDAHCQKIVQDAQGHLARLVIAVAEKLSLKGKIPVRCAGGLFKSIYFRKGFEKVLIRYSGRARRARAGIHLALSLLWPADPPL